MTWESPRNRRGFSLSGCGLHCPRTSKLFAGPVEVDETYLGGKRKNMSNAKRKELAGTGRGPVGKTAVVGAKDRETNQVAATVIQSTDAETLQGFVKDHADHEASVYTDDATAYESLPFDHDTVKHSLSEYVRGAVHTNGIESLWSLLKRAHTGHVPQNCPRSTWTATCRNSPAGTTCAHWTRSIRSRASGAGWRASGSPTRR